MSNIEENRPTLQSQLTRRRVLIGLVATGVVAGAGAIWRELVPHPLYVHRGHSESVEAVAWSPDGRRIASGSADHTVQVWDAADGDHVFTYKGHSSPVNAVAWSPDSKRIASGAGGYHQSDHTVQVWDEGDGGHVLLYKGHSDGVNGVAWSPDGKRIASAGGFDDKTVQVWNAVDGGACLHLQGAFFPSEWSSMVARWQAHCFQLLG